MCDDPDRVSAYNASCKPRDILGDPVTGKSTPIKPHVMDNVCEHYDAQGFSYVRRDVILDIRELLGIQTTLANFFGCFGYRFVEFLQNQAVTTPRLKLLGFMTKFSRCRSYVYGRKSSVENQDVFPYFVFGVTRPSTKVPMIDYYERLVSEREEKMLFATVDEQKADPRYFLGLYAATIMAGTQRGRLRHSDWGYLTALEAPLDAPLEKWGNRTKTARWAEHRQHLHDRMSVTLNPAEDCDSYY